MLKKAMKLPKRTMGAFFHTSEQHGGLGTVSLKDNMDMARITRMLCCLTSLDKTVQDMAWSQLASVARKRLK